MAKKTRMKKIKGGWPSWLGGPSTPAPAPAPVPAPAQPSTLDSLKSLLPGQSSNTEQKSNEPKPPNMFGFGKRKTSNGGKRRKSNSKSKTRKRR